MIPDHPGADLLEVGLRAEDTSSAVMAMKLCVGVGVGSSRWCMGMGVGSGGKKHVAKVVAMSAGSEERLVVKVQWPQEMTCPICCLWQE